MSSNVIDHNGYEVAGPMDDDMPYPQWGLFDEHEQMFVKAFWHERDAEAEADTLEVQRASELQRWPRWTVARIPEGDPIVDDFR